MADVTSLFDVPNRPSLRKAMTYAQFAPQQASVYGGADTAAVDAATKAQVAQGQGAIQQQTQGAPAGMADRMAYGAESAAQSAQADRLMKDYAAKRGLYGNYKNQLSLADAMDMAKWQTQADQAGMYSDLASNALGGVAGYGMNMMAGRGAGGSDAGRPPTIQTPTMPSSNATPYFSGGLPKKNYGLSLMGK